MSRCGGPNYSMFCSLVSQAPSQSQNSQKGTESTSIPIHSSVNTSINNQVAYLGLPSQLRCTSVHVGSEIIWRFTQIQGLASCATHNCQLMVAFTRTSSDPSGCQAFDSHDADADAEADPCKKSTSVELVQLAWNVPSTTLKSSCTNPTSPLQYSHEYGYSTTINPTSPSFPLRIYICAALPVHFESSRLRWAHSHQMSAV